jgi:hypothetical protein
MGSFGVHPLWFSKSAEVLENEWVAEALNSRVCKLLKVQGFAVCVNVRRGLRK